jgi:uncharacterized protein YgiM (DUF1202 family)
MSQIRAAYLRARYGAPANADVIPELIKVPLTPTRAAGIFSAELDELADLVLVKPWVLGYEPVHTQSFHSAHPAEDWAMPSWTGLRAAMWGRITYGYSNAGYANYLTITNDELKLQVLYAHMPAGVPGKLGLKTGDLVQPGQIVGYSDNTGNSTGPHLHMELRRYPYNGYASCIRFIQYLRTWTGGTVEPPTQPPPVEPPTVDPIKKDEELIVDTEGDNLNFREKPSTSAVIIKKLTDGTPLTASGDQQGKWIPVEYKLTGWVHADYVRRKV